MSIKFKLAIIIPVYGVEDYIIRLTDSLFPQLTKDVKLIFINDGCKDKSIFYLEQEINKIPLSHKNSIQIIHQDNQGLSAARNKGLMSAIDSVYTTFLDSDDTVVSHYILSLLNAIDEQHFDIMHFNFSKENKYHQMKVFQYVEKTQLTIIDQNTLNRIFHKNQWMSCIRVIRTELLSEFQFSPGYIYEDLLSLPFLYQVNLRLYEYDEPLFNYQYRESSITNSATNKNTLNSFEYGITIYREKINLQHYKYVYLYLLDLLFENYLKLSFKEYSSFIDNYKKNDLLIMKKYIKNFHWKKRLMIRFPKLFYFYKNRARLTKRN